MQANPQRRAHLVVRGRVQGVFFRVSTRDVAHQLGLTGWVRNLPSGNVEVLCEGGADAVNSFVEWCREGPEVARVRDVEITDEDPTGEFSDFRIG